MVVMARTDLTQGRFFRGLSAILLHSVCVCPSVILLVYRLYYIIIVVIGDGNEGNAG